MICGFNGPAVAMTESRFEAASLEPRGTSEGLSGLPSRCDLPFVGTGDESRKRSGVLRPSLSWLFRLLWPDINVPRLVLLP